MDRLAGEGYRSKLDERAKWANVRFAEFYYEIGDPFLYAVADYGEVKQHQDGTESEIRKPGIVVQGLRFATVARLLQNDLHGQTDDSWIIEDVNGFPIWGASFPPLRLGQALELLCALVVADASAE